MKKSTYLILLFVALFLNSYASYLDGVSSYKLENGLTIILNEDHSTPEVFGCVMIKSGARNEPRTSTGLAHYLEHMMFKGTTQLGTTNWEEEKPHYEKIIQLFEDLRATEDEDQKKEIYAKINEEAQAAGKYAIPNEFSNIIQAIGGTGLNAGTSYDYTQYLSFFPPFEIERWLNIYAHLFSDPVFRNFHTEVETVYEEKNMYANNPSRNLFEEIQKVIFENHPYSISIIGTTEHLKNPSMKEMINFFNKWYVPSNMALVLSGDINPEEIKPIIEKTFGAWEKKEKPVVEEYNVKAIKGKETFKYKITPYKIGVWAFNGIPMGHEDEVALEMTLSMLNNSNRIGLFDKLITDGDVISLYASSESLLDCGRIIINAIPMFDRNQYRQLSVGETEQVIFDELDKLKKGDFEEWVLDAIKKQQLQQLEFAFESSNQKAAILMDLFLQGKSFDEIEKYKSKIEAIDKNTIVEMANKYFNSDYYTFQFLEGTNKSEKVKKPKFDVIDPPKNAISEFQTKFKEMNIGDVEEKFLNLEEEMTSYDFADKVKLYYKQNEKNNIFSLIIRYGAGTNQIPSLDYAVSLMNRAGVMVQYTPQEFKEGLAKLGCNLNFFTNEDYTYAQLIGNEDNLGEACKMLSKVVLLPQLDKKQMDAIIGNEIISRNTEKKQSDYLADAISEYLVYKDKSEYIDRLSEEELDELKIKDLTGDFLKATQYEANIHYCGKESFENVVSTLKSNLAFANGLNESNSPVQRELASYDKKTILFLNDKEATQSQIYFFINEDDYSLDELPQLRAFNQYIGGGFNGLVLQEIREFRSFAYTAAGGIRTPDKPGLKKYFYGYIGTQGDKTCDAIETYVDILENMPEKPERIDNIKTYLVNSSLSNKPTVRNTTMTIESWKELGFDKEPAEVLIPKYRELTFDDILKYYNDKINGKPYAIAIVGNSKEIDLDRLGKIAKVKKLSTSDVFK